MGTRGLPPGALNEDHLKTLFMVMALAQPTTTIPQVARRLGVCVSVAFRRLEALRDAGLVTWEPAKKNTLRSLVGATPLGVSGG